MGWEQRRGKLDDHSKVRRGGRVVSQYLGNGEYAHAVAFLEADCRRRERRLRLQIQADEVPHRRQRHERREEERRFRAQLIHGMEGDDADWDAAYRWVEAVVRGTPVAAGCYRHHQGEWRRRQGMGREAIVRAAEELIAPHLGSDAAGPATRVPKAGAETMAAAPLERGDADEQAGPLGGHRVPRLPLLGPWSDVRKRTEWVLISWMSADPGVRDAARLRLAILRRELAGDAPTPLERLLVDRIVVCWTEVLACDERLVATSSCRESRAFITALENRRGRAHRRFLAAIKALATTRKLLGVPASAKPLDITGSGGTHFLLRHDPAYRVLNKPLAPGIDLRGDGGMIVVEPSAHPNGKEYVWHPHHPRSGIAQVPAWLWRRLREAGLAVPRLVPRPDRGHDGREDTARDAPSGTRTGGIDILVAELIARFPVAERGTRDDGMKRVVASLIGRDYAAETATATLYAWWVHFYERGTIDPHVAAGRAA